MSEIDGTRSATRVRVLAEVALVFLGILAAFALEGWREDRRDRAREVGLLTEMVAEFAAAEAQGESLLAGHLDRRARIVELHRLLRTDEASLYPDSTLDLTLALWEVAAFQPEMPAYQSLVNADGLAFVRDDSLRTALRAYELIAGANREYDDFWREHDVNVLTPVLGARLPVFAWIFGDGDHGGELRPSIDDLAADMEFRNLIGLRSTAEGVLIQRRTDLVEAIREVRRLLSIELS